MSELKSNIERDEFSKLVLEKSKTLFSKSKKKESPAFLTRLKPMLSGSKIKFFLIKLLDSSLRSSKSKAINRHVQFLLKKYPGHVVLFSPLERFFLGIYKFAGKHLPSISIPMMVKQIKGTTRDVIFDFESSKFADHAKKRKQNRIKQNINLIGESLLGEQEADERIKAYKALINQPDIDYISVKISTIYSQISSLAYDETLNVLKKKLSILYDESIRVATSTGKKTFINLDMEEYRDLSLTVDLFQSLLSEKRYGNLYAGIVLQAYVPDSYHYLIRLQKWSLEKVKKGGAAIKVRIVKGANLEMEKHESSLTGWPLAPHHKKMHADAQFKAMLFQSLTYESCQGLHLGVATHNIFDMSFAICLIEEHGLREYVDIEMLEGLAENLIPSLQKLELNILLYTPVIKENQFLSGIAYLVRRLDEATAKGNFLRESVGMSFGDKSWISLQKAFETSFNHVFEMKFESNKIQDRLAPPLKNKSHTFKNSPDTDWTIESNRVWAHSIKKRWQKDTLSIPLVLPEYANNDDREILEPNNWEGRLPWSIRLATLTDYQLAIEDAKKSSWNQYSVQQRAEVILAIGVILEENRGDLIGVGMLEVGKLISDMDTEISEAIDFANYYAKSITDIDSIPDISSSSKGTNLILSPWNFPIAIPAGGILASLAVGNTVIIKPAKRSVACSYLLVNLIHQAGVPKSALHFLPAHSSEIKTLLSPKSVFASVILTGGTETARTLLNQNPDLNLFAETGGKNATIVTGFADKELAIKNVVDSAFGNTGQKCSATSLLIIEKSAGTPQFYQLLIDAVKSKKVGSPWEFDTKVGPLANPIEGQLKVELLKNKNWLLKGEIKGNYEVSPFIKKVLSTTETCFQNELFGPHLSIIEVDNIKEAVRVANKVSFGLTSGIESLNEDQVTYWKDNIQAGNLYINRGTTGAIVQRQAFGGLKLSSFGPGMKAGGNNYLLQLLNHSMQKETDDSLSYAKQSFQHWKSQLFEKEIDLSNIRGQKNISRYLKPDIVVVMVSSDTLQKELNIVKLACKTLKIKYALYSLDDSITFASDEVNVIESWKKLLDVINWNTRIRCLTKSISPEFRIAMINKAVYIYDKTPIEQGRIELLNYLQEQTISHNFHRYGNLMGED
jgi:RHH-type proline utilization regulon transcriptional repressor/proline dehydrogenase/delta 1-pyrroline-5-carboxylate dehydrogenase